MRFRDGRKQSRSFITGGVIIPAAATKGLRDK
jgi:hypothetical protein